MKSSGLSYSSKKTCGLQLWNNASQVRFLNPGLDSDDFSHIPNSHPELNQRLPCARTPSVISLIPITIRIIVRYQIFKANTVDITLQAHVVFYPRSLVNPVISKDSRITAFCDINIHFKWKSVSETVNKSPVQRINPSITSCIRITLSIHAKFIESTG